MKKIVKSALPYVCSFFVVFLLWIIIAKIQNSELFFPGPKKVFMTFLGLLGDKNFYIYLFNTVFRVVLAFLISLILAIILATISKLSPFFRSVCYPFIILARATPTMSIIFLCYMWFSNTISPIVVCSLIIIPTLYSAFLGGMTAIDSSLEEMCDVFKVKKSTVFFKFYFPQVLKNVYGDVKNAFSLSIKLIIASEVISSTPKSLGVIMQLSKSYLEIDKLFAITIVAVLVGILVDISLDFIKNIVSWWNYAKAKKHN